MLKNVEKLAESPSQVLTEIGKLPQEQLAAAINSDTESYYNSNPIAKKLLQGNLNYLESIWKFPFTTSQTFFEMFVIASRRMEMFIEVFLNRMQSPEKLARPSLRKEIEAVAKKFTSIKLAFEHPGIDRRKAVVVLSPQNKKREDVELGFFQVLAEKLKASKIFFFTNNDGGLKKAIGVNGHLRTKALKTELSGGKKVSRQNFRKRIDDLTGHLSPDSHFLSLMSSTHPAAVIFSEPSPEVSAQFYRNALYFQLQHAITGPFMHLEKQALPEIFILNRHASNGKDKIFTGIKEGILANIVGKTISIQDLPPVHFVNATTTETIVSSKKGITIAKTDYGYAAPEEIAEQIASSAERSILALHSPSAVNSDIPFWNQNERAPYWENKELIESALNEMRQIPHLSTPPRNNNIGIYGEYLCGVYLAQLVSRTLQDVNKGLVAIKDIKTKVLDSWLDFSEKLEKVRYSLVINGIGTARDVSVSDILRQNAQAIAERLVPYNIGVSTGGGPGWMEALSKSFFEAKLRYSNSTAKIISLALDWLDPLKNREAIHGYATDHIAAFGALDKRTPALGYTGQNVAIIVGRGGFGTDEEFFRYLQAIATHNKSLNLFSSRNKKSLPAIFILDEHLTDIDENFLDSEIGKYFTDPKNATMHRGKEKQIDTMLELGNIAAWVTDYVYFIRKDGTTFYKNGVKKVDTSVVLDNPDAVSILVEREVARVAKELAGKALAL